MPKMLGVRFDDIGHANARLDGLNIRTEIGGIAQPTVLWLRNGGGKSSIVALLCSVFLPHASDFATKGERRSLDGYVVGNGVAVIATEWTAPGDPEGRTRIVGTAMSRKASDGGGLRRNFFSFLAGNGASLPGLGEEDPIASFPIRKLGGRVKNLAEFNAWVRALDRKSPSRDVFITDNQGDWTDFLAKRNFERSEFKLIAAMNRKEGGASDTILDFKSDTDFVDFVVEQVYDAESFATLRGTVSTARKDVSDLEPLRARIAFAEEAKPLLTEYGTLEAGAVDAGAARKIAETTVSRAARDVGSVAKSADFFVATAESAAVDFARLIADASASMAKDADRAAALALHAAACDSVEARLACDERIVEAATARRTVHAAECGPSLILKRVAEAEHAASAEAQRLAQEPLKELRRLLSVASGEYATALELRISEIQKSISGFSDDAKRHETESTAESDAASKAVSASGAANGEIVRLRASMIKQKGDLATLNADETLLPGEIVNDGVARWAETRRKAVEGRAVCIETESAAISAIAELKSAAKAAERQASEAYAEIAEIDGEFSTFFTGMDNLVAHPAIPLLSDGDELPDFWGAGLVERSDEFAKRLRQTAQFRREATKAASTVANTIDASGGLLPLASDTGAVIRDLQALKINGHGYARYLAENGSSPEEIERLLLADPARYGGVVVIGQNGFDKARDYQPEVRLSGPVQIVSLDAPPLPAAKGRVVVGIHPASFDRSIATRLVQDARRDARDADAAANAEEISAASLEDLARALTRFLTRFPADWEFFKRKTLESSRSQAASSAAEAAAAHSAVLVQEALRKFAVEGSRSFLLIDRNAESCGSALREFVREHSRTVADLGNMVETSERAVHALESDASTHRAAEADARLRAETSRSAVKTAGVEMGKLKLDRGNLGRVELGKSVSFETAAATHAALKAQIENASGDMALNQRVDANAKSAEQARKNLDRDLNRTKPALTVEEVEPWAGKPEEQVEALRQEAKLADGIVMTASNAAHAVETELERLAKEASFDVRAINIDDDVDANEAREEACILQVAVETASVEILKSKAAAKQSVEDREKASTTALLMRNLLIPAPEWARTVAHDAIPDDTLSVDDVMTSWIKAFKALGVETDASNAAVAVANVAKRRLEKAIRDPRWENALKQVVVNYLGQLEAGVMASNVVATLAEIDQFEAFARMRLASVDETTESLIQAVDLQIADIRSALCRLSKASVVPEHASMGAWAGRSFVEIDLDGENAEERLACVRRAVVQMCAGSGDLPTPIDFACMILHETFHRPARVSMLKPGLGFDTHRHRVTEVMSGSGGEKLTAAVLLYVALRKLSRSRRSRGEGGSMLLLDNPIGSCNLVELLTLQRRVSDACGVQLLFTTGINDLEAIRVFPLVVALKNEARNARTGQRLVEHSDEPSGMESVRIEFHPDA